MSATSKKYFEEKFKREVWKNLVGEIRKINSEKDLIKILERVLTSAELNLLEKRAGILYLLNGGASYRKISEIIDVHRGTISFIKRKFKKPQKRIVKKRFKSKELLDIEAREGEKNKPLFSTKYKGVRSII